MHIFSTNFIPIINVFNSVLSIACRKLGTVGNSYNVLKVILSENSIPWNSNLLMSQIQKFFFLFCSFKKNLWPLLEMSSAVLNSHNDICLQGVHGFGKRSWNTNNYSITTALACPPELNSEALKNHTNWLQGMKKWSWCWPGHFLDG